MRPSSRPLILDAAIRVTERDGITALTLESAAREAGVTKAGLMYHFPSREDLLFAIQKHLITRWEERLAELLGKPLAEATVRESTTAYTIEGAANTASKAELTFMLESTAQPALARQWDELMHRWAPLPERLEEPADVDLLLARMASDGMWLYEATSGAPLPAPLKAALVERITALTDPARPRA
ncbi:TetR/AcrR family transcriptional regulator [Streptomyces carpaticus]|uniref:DNA-binding transcriptional regulator YbjK n=2 Tax=Streptomyces TaxID=1883 RepID=A0A1I6U0I0_9ACTN|nr:MULTISPECIES: TetR/AcrR family transcriptional regulator [Streptomyces]UWM50955.1 TetR/AcrR family transcriptional regulator [Streptomyces carpaticus]SFS94930.1 DNA-binding transcriptional regulator YbjK [Streptomyces harbinensis]